MAELNLGTPGSAELDLTPNNEQASPVDGEAKIDGTVQEPTEEATPTVETNSAGMTIEELNDPNKIKVTIADQDTALVVLFGPPSCGKTMTLIRLTRYLNTRGFTVKPVTSFRPSYDKNYKDMCDGFDKMINSDEAAKSTSNIGFMLIQVSYKGKPLCQILEGPGELYFNPQEPKAEYPGYLNKIISSKNRKLWIIMVEPDDTSKNMDIEFREVYAVRVKQLKTKMKSNHKVIFVFNKIDRTDFVINPGNVRYSSAIKYISDQYPSIFSSFVNENPLTKWFQPYNFGFVAFQTGNFSKANDGTLTFEEGDEVYPRKLWDMIRKRI